MKTRAFQDKFYNEFRNLPWVAGLGLLLCYPVRVRNPDAGSWEAIKGRDSLLPNVIVFPGSAATGRGRWMTFVTNRNLPTHHLIFSMGRWIVFCQNKVGEHLAWLVSKVKEREWGLQEVRSICFYALQPLWVSENHPGLCQLVSTVGCMEYNPVEPKAILPGFLPDLSSVHHLIRLVLPVKSTLASALFPACS